MPVYATPAHLAQYITGDPDATGEQAPAKAVPLLRSASLLVREATHQAIYKTDVNGLPTDPLLVIAMRDATCAMAQAYSILGIDPMVGSAGLSQNVSAKALGSASVSYATAQDRESAKSALADGRTLTTEAYLTLKHAGLLSSGVVSDVTSVVGPFIAGPWPVQ